MTRTKNFLRQNFFKVLLKTTFFHDLCHPDHYEPKIFFRFSKSGFTLRYTISDSRVLPCNAISEGRPPLQHELGSGSSRYRRDVSRMTRTKNFLRQNFFKVFLKTTFFHDLCHPDHYEPKIFFRFSKSGSTLRYTISDSRSRKAGLPCATRARKQELSILEGRIENDSDQKFSKKTTFFHDVCHPDHYEPKIFFRFFKSGPEGFPIMSVIVR